MSTVLKLGMNGAAGRMGQRVVALATQDKAFQLVGAYESSSSKNLGNDAGTLAGVGPLGVAVSSTVQPPVDVIIDFSTPEGCQHILKECLQKKIPLVIATTGVTAEQRTEIQNASKQIPLLMAPSMSLAVNIAMNLVSQAGNALKDHTSGVDVEIIERHHRYKEDAPSGTALKFGEIVAKSMGQTKHVHGREGRTGLRPQNEIGYHALRVGDNVGEHTIVFGMLGETLEVSVRGQSRDSYALGALAAAKFLVKQGPGLYNMNDVLGL